MNDKPPIFVVGNPRSGTTLMRVLLSAHPNIYITHEPWFYIWNSLCPDDVSGDQFLRYYFQTFSFRWLKIARSEVLKNLPPTLPRKDVHWAFREIMRLKAEALGRNRYGEKTPGETDYLKDIYEDFPDARVIVMVRDPRSTVDSTRKMVWGSKSDLANAIVYERTRRKIDKFRDRVLIVKLETLRLDPEGEMRRVLEFVGEEWDPAVLDHAANNPAPDDMPPVPWLRTASEPLVSTEMRLPNMAPERLRLIETVCRTSMSRYGYEPLELENAPGFLDTMGRIASEIPATARYAWLVARLFQKLRDPRKWGELSVYIQMYTGLNPPWWEENKDFKVPGPPDLIEEPALPESERDLH